MRGGGLVAWEDTDLTYTPGNGYGALRGLTSMSG